MTVNVSVVAVVSVPLRVPPDDSVKPAGSAPVVTAKVNGPPSPPAAESACL